MPLSAIGPAADIVTLLDASRPEIASLLVDVASTREGQSNDRSWSHPQEPAGMRGRSKPGADGHDLRTRPVFYRLRDEPVPPSSLLAASTIARPRSTAMN